ncbi:MAG: HAD-IB family hydrolase [Bacteroidota bacterium]
MGGKISTAGKRIIAAFDFDGTITNSDSLWSFIKYNVRYSKILTGAVLFAQTMLLFKLRLISNQVAKEKLMKIFFAGVDYNHFLKICDNFSDKIDLIVRQKALNKIKWHIAEGHEVVIISASPQLWILPWAISNGIETVIATRLEIIDNTITGRFMGKNCHGKEKIARFIEIYPNREDYILYAYGDSSGDRPLLGFADLAFYKKF